MQIDSSLFAFCSHGYVKIKIADTNNLRLLRLKVMNVFKESLLANGLNAGMLERLDGLHNILNLPDINNFRIDCIERLNALEGFNARLLLDPLPDFFTSLFGPDQLIQKSVNLVIQRPADQDNSELHRDYPGNSEFEIVVWIPMVNCPVDMSMYVLDFHRSVEVARGLERNAELGWDFLKQRVKEHAKHIPVDFGEALVFMTPLFHGSNINTTDRTRVSFNFRLKGLFYPCGMRDPYAFWSVLRTSAFTSRMLQDLHE